MKLPLAGLAFMLIPYDSLTHLLGLDPGETSQTFPLTALISLPYLAIRAGTLQRSSSGDRVLRLFFAAATCMVLATLGNAIVDALTAAVLEDEHLRWITAARQGISLALGLTSFLMFQDALLRIGHARAIRYIVAGALPSFALCLYQAAGGAFRVQGFSSEPSHLGDMLVFAFFPACAFVGIRLRYRLSAASFGLLAMLAAFSGTAFLKGGLALFGFSAVRGYFIGGAVAVAAAMLATYFALSFFPDNYIFILWGLFQSYLESGTLVGGSFIDRFFGLLGPLGMLGELHGWLGLGLGGDTLYFDRIFDADTAAAIRLEKGAIVSISSLQAKTLLYGGVIGYWLYLKAWATAWRCAPWPHPAKFMIPTILLASLFSLGPYFLPYTWLWLAFGVTASPAWRLRTARCPPRQPDRTR